MTSTEGGSIKSPNFPSNYPDNKVQVTTMSNERNITCIMCLLFYSIITTWYMSLLLTFCKWTILFTASYSNTPRSGTCPWLPAPRFSSPSRASPWRPTAGELLTCDWLAGYSPLIGPQLRLRLRGGGGPEVLRRHQARPHHQPGQHHEGL